MRKKTLLALAFAGGLVNPILPVMAEKSECLPNATIEKVATCAEAEPPARAFCLLLIARSFLSGDGRIDWMTEYDSPQSLNRFNYQLLRRNGLFISSWANQMSQIAHEPTIADQASRAVAKKAIQEALVLADKTSNIYARLNLIFIASCLSKKMGDNDCVSRCDRILEDAFHDCERSTMPEPDKVIAVSSVLNSMAYGVMPIEISDRMQPISNIRIRNQTFSEQKLRYSEQLRLRAIAMADRLPQTADARRKAHRDMSLWYTEVGKADLAEKQKETLFDLVGIRDDRILYPVAGACGDLIWWQTKTPTIDMGCGMG